MLSTHFTRWTLTAPILVALACSSSAKTPDSAVGGSDTIAADASTSSPDPQPCESSCSSVQPSYPTNEAWGGVGNVTTYSTSPSAGGACQYGTTQVRYFAAISVNLQPGDGKGAWQNGRICGLINWRIK